MGEVAGTVITSMEVAQMVDKRHADLLKDIRRYCEQLAEGKISLGNFFSESKYQDSNNQERPCFLVTKKGCEFIAHKLTGQKGTEFTARYINRFHEMEKDLMNPQPAEIPVGELASYLKVMDRVAVRQNLAPYKIAENFKKVSAQFGVQLTADFVKVPEYEQLSLDFRKGGGAA
ncbi:MAG: Rha family transcriptional regulator [Lachnospiraceae bacterium]|nr:Rha family transcriptional regulator [Lachnospiraceae bacterium]